MSSRNRTRSATRLAGAAFALTAAMLPLAGTGAAYASDTPTGAGGVLLSPAKISQTIHPGPVTVPVTLRNTTTVEQTVSLSAAPLAHTLDGAVYPGPQRTGGALLTFDTATVDLAAGQTQTVDTHGTLAPEGGGIYAALTADVTPASGPAGNVTSRVQLISVIELASDTAADRQIRIGTITAHEGTMAGTVQFDVVVHNTGNIAVSPHGHLTIQDSSRQLADLPLAAATAIPGNARRLSAVWRADPAQLGELRIHVMLTDPPADAWTTIPFTAGLPQHQSAVITALRYDQQHGRTLLTVTNTGNLPVTGDVTATAASRGAPPVTANTTLTALAPGQRRDVTITSRLNPGRYLLTATLRTGTTILDTTTANVIVTRPPAHRWVYLLGLLAALILAAAITIRTRWHRRARHGHPQTRPHGSLQVTGPDSADGATAPQPTPVP